MRRQLVLGTIGSLVALLYLTGALDFVERHLHDFRSGLLSRPASGEIVLVTIDRESLQRHPGWPWPRQYHATVIERLIDAGATRIAVAIDFSTPSDIQNDRRLAAALARAGPERVALPVFRPRGGEADEARARRRAPSLVRPTLGIDVRRCVARPGRCGPPLRSRSERSRRRDPDGGRVAAERTTEPDRRVISSISASSRRPFLASALRMCSKARSIPRGRQESESSSAPQPSNSGTR